jgi:hypothetical protein
LFERRLKDREYSGLQEVFLYLSPLYLSPFYLSPLYLSPLDFVNQCKTQTLELVPSHFNFFFDNTLLENDSLKTVWWLRNTLDDDDNDDDDDNNNNNNNKQ